VIAQLSEATREAVKLGMSDPHVVVMAAEAGDGQVNEGGVRSFQIIDTSQYIELPATS
jgi:hypothetical protein